jgi:hypothetical protein
MKFRGTGLAAVQEQKCMGCQVKLRPQMYNEVWSGKEIIYCDTCQRVLYFDSASEKKEEKAVEEAHHARRRVRPKAESAQAWFFRPDYGTDEVLLVFTNNGGNSSRRVYEMHTGRQIGDTLTREGAYRLAFPEDLTETTIRLNGFWAEEEMDGWVSEVPTSALDVLQTDLRAAQKERHSSRKGHAKSHTEATPESSPVEHTTAVS